MLESLLTSKSIQVLNKQQQSFVKGSGGSSSCAGAGGGEGQGIPSCHSDD